MKKLRTVEKIKGGERFQEVTAKDHAAVLAAYMADSKNNPCPMIRGHQMFKHPHEYGCRLVDKI